MSGPRDPDHLEDVLILELPLTAARQRVIDDFERRHVRYMLERHGGNVRRAATAAGVGRRYFQKLKARQTK
jgi:hypothetical protein